MNTTEPAIPVPRPLPNKPLVEAIFELHWGLQSATPHLPPRDPGFRILLGRYYDRIRHDYPHVQDLPTVNVPEELTAHVVRHQFRAGHEQWPLTQLGPGILTVNETAAYEWSTFQPRLARAISALFASYPTDVAPLNPIAVQLRYINAIPYDPASISPMRFLAELLHTNVNVEPLLFDDPQNPDEASSVNLEMSFPLTNPIGLALLGLSTGLRDGDPCIIMQITIRSDGSAVPKQPHNYLPWLDTAHNIVDKWFFTLCRGTLLSAFESQHGNT